MPDYTRAHVFVRQELDGMPSILISRALLSAALLVAILPAYGGTFKQLGRADPTTPLTTYGMQVDPERAIKTVVPSSWQSSVHPGTPLAEKVSWEPADNWVTVINRIADQNDAGVLIDWPNKRILFRPLGVALEEEAKLEQVRQAATTPLPAYTPRAEAEAASRPVVAPTDASPNIVAAPPPRATPPVGPNPATPAPAPAVAGAMPPRGPTTMPAPIEGMPPPAAMSRGSSAPAGATTTSGGPNPATAPTTAASSPTWVVEGVNKGLQSSAGPAPSSPVKTAPPPAMASQTAQPVAAPPKGPGASRPPSSPAPAQGPKAPTAGPSRSFNDVPTKVAAEALANLHGYKLVWQAGNDYLPGPVTLMGSNINDDFLLLSRALGPNYPVMIQLIPAKKELVARYKDPERHMAALEQQQRLVAQGQAAQSQKAAANPAILAGAPAGGPAANPLLPGGAGPSPVAIPGPRELVLDIKRGETLSFAMERFLKKEGWQLEWKVGGDLKAGSDMSLRGAGVTQVLDQILPRLGMAADLYNPSKLAVIRVASYTPSKSNQ